MDLVGVAAKLSDCAILPVQAQLQRGSREGTSACRQLWSTVRRVDFRDCRASIRQQPGSERACNILAEVDHLNAHKGQALVHRRLWDFFYAFHQFDQNFAILRATGRKTNAAVAHHDGRCAQA